MVNLIAAWVLDHEVISWSQLTNDTTGEVIEYRFTAWGPKSKSVWPEVEWWSPEELRSEGEVLGFAEAMADAVELEHGVRPRIIKDY